MLSRWESSHRQNREGHLAPVQGLCPADKGPASQAGAGLKVPGHPWRKHLGQQAQTVPSGPPSMSLLSGHWGHFVQFLALISSWVRCCKLFFRKRPMENNFMGSLSHSPRVNCPLASWESTFAQPQPLSTSIRCALSPRSQEIAFWNR